MPYRELDIVKPGEEMPPPVTARGLLIDLRRENAPRPDQERAVAAWLGCNQPGERLTASLRHNGFLP